MWRLCSGCGGGFGGYSGSLVDVQNENVIVVMVMGDSCVCGEGVDGSIGGISDDDFCVVRVILVWCGGVAV